MSEPEPGEVAQKFFLSMMIGTALYVGVVCAFVLFR